MLFGYIRDLLSSFRTQEKTTKILGTNTKCFHQHPHFTPGDLSKTLTTLPTDSQPPNSFCGCGEPGPTGWVHREPSEFGPG